MRENTRKLGTGFGLVTMVATLVVGLILQAAPADAGTAEGNRVTARWSGAINTRSMAAVNEAYWSQYASQQSVPIGWVGGSLLGCLPGMSSATSNQATLTALNYVRSLAGLAPVTLNGSLNAGAQAAALMMSANGALSHDPSSSWKCYSAAGASAANFAVGHRRWVLNPFTTQVGTGSTDTANALTVIGPTSSARPNPRWVGWPTAGYFPNAIEPDGRWSLSSGRRNVSFAHAKVRVYYGGHRVPVHQYRVENGYAQPTIVWQMPAGFATTGSYKVVVKRIKKKGSRRLLHTAYTVNLFTPTP